MLQCGGCRRFFYVDKKDQKYWILLPTSKYLLSLHFPELPEKWVKARQNLIMTYRRTLEIDRI